MRVFISMLCFISFLGFSYSFSVFESDSENNVEQAKAPAQADKTIQCYSCDSNNGECDDEHTGETTECEVERGCNIMTNNDNIYARGCSVNEEPGCSDDTLTHSCDCLTALCNKDWTTAGAENKMKCYSCDSHDGECDEAHAGSEIDCSVEEGCVISTDVFDGETLFMRGCSGELENQGCNNEDNATTCICLEPLCNFNWVVAGSTEQPDGPTEPTDKTIQCYSCDSYNGECDDEHTGETTDCPVERGCNIMTNKDNIYARGCSANEEPGCSDDTLTHSCDCLTPLCNKDWTTAGAEDKIKCYSCDSHNGECDEAHAGTEIDCSVEEGCVISTDVFEGKSLFMRGCSGELEYQGCNNEDNATTCVCLEPLCNFDWSSAGSTTASSDTTHPAETTPQGPTVKCYKCDSSTGDCTNDAHGETVECPESEGCTIRQTVGNQGDRMMVRDCSSEKDIVCDSIEKGEGWEIQIVHFCNCNTALCNGDWTSAGSTKAPPPTTAAPGAACRMSSALAVALGIAGALVVIL